ncbi:protein translocase subunit SecF [Pseudothermotoga thermarum]|uniref:Protein-export membrane protein SecF n=1 Tax=Pseudothermotoga thermarum DSM 5069 TaxID=688269 RepID=F7YX19_9THEM|nr:protein translocase subunit SecF [Pseudothermotoga thermarum]AEH50524.1 protein translocase subunit secF [Pseudothermotoga thermarum DSM 5069]
MKYFDFVGKRKIFIGISVVLIVVSLLSIFTKGFRLGVEFLGGSEIILRVEQKNFSESDVRSSLTEISPKLSAARVTKIRAVGEAENVEKFSITLPFIFEAEEKADLQKQIEEKLLARNIKGTIVSFNETSGFAAQEIRGLTWRAILITLVAILAYISLRFSFVFGIGAVAALAHDVLITLGFFSIASYELNVPAVAALLTLIGYSLNNTIIIYDRIRENMRKFKGKAISEIINQSTMQVLRRTINTSLTTFIVVFVLLLFAGNAIKPFAFGMTVGVVVGTYSSIFVAAPLVANWVKQR